MPSRGRAPPLPALLRAASGTRNAPAAAAAAGAPPAASAAPCSAAAAACWLPAAPPAWLLGCAGLAAPVDLAPADLAPAGLEAAAPAAASIGAPMRPPGACCSPCTADSSAVAAAVAVAAAAPLAPPPLPAAPPAAALRLPPPARRPEPADPPLLAAACLAAAWADGRLAAGPLACLDAWRPPPGADALPAAACRGEKRGVVHAPSVTAAAARPRHGDKGATGHGPRAHAFVGCLVRGALWVLFVGATNMAAPPSPPLQLLTFFAGAFLAFLRGGPSLSLALSAKSDASEAARLSLLVLLDAPLPAGAPTTGGASQVQAADGDVVLQAGSSAWARAQAGGGAGSRDARVRYASSVIRPRPRPHPRPRPAADNDSPCPCGLPEWKSLSWSAFLGAGPGFPWSLSSSLSICKARHQRRGTQRGVAAHSMAASCGQR